MEIYGIIMMMAYFTIMCFVLPSGRVNTDILKVRLRLLPFGFKFIGLAWLIFVLCYSFINNWVYFSQNNFLFIGMNLGLLLLVVSRDRKEDEFSNHLRLRSMYLSALILFFLAGVFVTGSVWNTNSFPKNSIIYLVLLLNVSLLVYLTYYYLSKYIIHK